MNHEPATEHHTLQRSGSTIHYWTSGQNAAPLITFTHGASLDHRMFDAQIAALTEAGYRVLTWDMRGHGRSKPMGAAFNVQVVAGDLLAIVDQLGVETTTLIGHSFGGFVTQEVTFRQPERVKALGVIGCTDIAAKPSRRVAAASKLLPYLLPRFSLESFRKQTVAHVSTREDVTRYAYEATGQLSKAEYIEVIIAGVTCLAKDSGYGREYTIPRPFLLTHGERDEANKGIFPESAPAWARKEPLCTYKVVPQAGHIANQDNPLAFNAILLDFLCEHVPVQANPPA